MNTPEFITELKPNQVFVFGANARGIHGAGAAKKARDFGAKIGTIHYCGQTYGIDTMSGMAVLKEELARFDEFTTDHPELEFLVTKIGTGLAGYSIQEIKQLFSEFTWPINVILPIEFQNFPSQQWEYFYLTEEGGHKNMIIEPCEYDVFIFKFNALLLA